MTGDQVGVQTMIVRVVGGIPGPVMFGHFIDNTCTLWSHEPGGECCVDMCRYYLHSHHSGG